MLNPLEIRKQHLSFCDRETLNSNRTRNDVLFFQDSNLIEKEDIRHK